MHHGKVRGDKLHLGWLLKELVSDGSLVQADDKSIAAKQRTKEEALMHPLHIIAAKQCCHAKTQQPFNLEDLCQWLAAKAGLDFAPIDPLKINVPAVTAEISFAYAQRYGILCIEVNAHDLVVATKQTFVRTCIESLEQTSQKSCDR